MCNLCCIQVAGVDAHVIKPALEELGVACRAAQGSLIIVRARDCVGGPGRTGNGRTVAVPLVVKPRAICISRKGDIGAGGDHLALRLGVDDRWRLE